MTQQHPITPPPELIEQWLEMWPQDALLDAAQWGADQELEACIEWMKKMGYWGEDGKAISRLRAARRPKPPSLKEQALEMLEITRKDGHIGSHAAGTIRRALEQLDD